MKNNKYLSVSIGDLVLLGCLVFRVTWYVCDVCCLDFTSHTQIFFPLGILDLALCVL